MISASSPRFRLAQSACAALVALAALTFGGCGKGATREWRADDHDEEPGSQTQAAPGGNAANGGGEEALVDATWRSTCSICHGALGRGDGPNGPMVKAPDLTAPALQDARTDDQLAEVIRKGRGKMPAFGQLPAGVVAGLVKRIRALRAP